MKKEDPYAELLYLCAKGDQQAFTRLYEETSGKLLATGIRILGTRQAAEDVLQESFVKIWQKSHSFDGSKASSMTWMTTIARNRSLDVLRSLKCRPQESDIEYEGVDFATEDLAPEDRVGLSVMTNRVVNCLDELKDQQKESVLMAYYYGQTHEEIAQELGAPLGTVKAWIRRGVERLRKCLE